MSMCLHECVCVCLCVLHINYLTKTKINHITNIWCVTAKQLYILYMFTTTSTTQIIDAHSSTQEHPGLSIPDSGVLWNTDTLHFPCWSPWVIRTENSYIPSAESFSITSRFCAVSLYSQRADSPFSLYLTVYCLQVKDVYLHIKTPP